MFVAQWRKFSPELKDELVRLHCESHTAYRIVELIQQKFGIKLNPGAVITQAESIMREEAEKLAEPVQVMLSVKEAAQETRLSRQQLKEYIKIGVLPSVKIGGSRLIDFVHVHLLQEAYDIGKAAEGKINWQYYSENMAAMGIVVHTPKHAVKRA